MKLNTIGEGYWSTIANYLNYNFNKLSVATNKYGMVGITNVHHKGVFINETELKNRFPNPEAGDFAFVIGDDQPEGSKIEFWVYIVKEEFWFKLDEKYMPPVDETKYLETSLVTIDYPENRHELIISEVPEKPYSEISIDPYNRNESVFQSSDDTAELTFRTSKDYRQKVDIEKTDDNYSELKLQNFPEKQYRPGRLIGFDEGYNIDDAE